MEMSQPPKSQRLIRKTFIKNTAVVLSGVVVFGVLVFTMNPDARFFLGSLISLGPGTVEPTDPSHFAYAENLGWIDFNPTGGDVVVDDAGLTGYAWSENTGWIHLDYDGVAGATNTTSTDWGVVNDGLGNLSGYAYGENVGWISFDPVYSGTHYQVVISAAGVFSGYAYGENVGWISFNCSNTTSCLSDGGYDYKVSTDWRHMYEPVATTLTIQTQPASTRCYQNYLTTQPSVLVKDQHGSNISDGTVVTASVASGTGSLTGATATTVSGVATFETLIYSEAKESFSILFTVDSATATSNSVGPLDINCGGGSGYTPTTEPIKTPATMSTTIPPAKQSEIIEYVSNELEDLRLYSFQGSPIFAEPTTQPPSNLQPTQPPPSQTSAISPDNQSAIIQVMQKLLKALKDLLGMVSQ